MTPLDRYRQDLQRSDFRHDPAQEAAVEHLDRLFHILLATPPSSAGWRGRLARLSGRPNKPIAGLYFWGGVGRGKTYLMDAFYDCLPFEQRMRLHFHRFMERIHHALRDYRDRSDPLKIIGRELAQQTRVLCLDEFFVSDITDAMLLGGLLDALFHNGVTLLSTSNIPPDQLYLNGLQRARFLPAIELIETHTQVVNVDGGSDHRLRYLERAEVYHTPLDAASEEKMEENFRHLAPTDSEADARLEIEERPIQTVRVADDVVWFQFSELCDGPRGTADYIEIARCYHSVLISAVPVFTWESENQARRFLNLVDEFYDRGVKLILSAAAPLEGLYQGQKLAFEYERARSRLHEMQTHDYLAQAHRP